MEPLHAKFSKLIPVLFGLLIVTPALAIEFDEDGRVLPELTLKWSPNPEPDIGGYVVYYGRESGEYGRSLTVTGTTSATIMVPEGLMVYLAVTAWHAAGVESEFSDEISWP